MSVTLYYHPYSRAANVVWMLEETGCEYAVQYVDLMTGEHKQPAYRAHNPMGKLPILVDGDAVVTESAAIGLYLADRYAPGRLAPALDAPERGAYLRWSLYAPSVIEPGCMAKVAGWAFKASQAGWGTYDEMLDTISAAIERGPWLLGEHFTMADVIFGGTIRFMIGVKMIDARPEYLDYVQRLDARPAAIAAKAYNERSIEEHGLKR